MIDKWHSDEGQTFMFENAFMMLVRVCNPHCTHIQDISRVICKAALHRVVDAFTQASYALAWGDPSSCLHSLSSCSAEFHLLGGQLPQLTSLGLLPSNAQKSHVITAEKWRMIVL